jgi:hypothetical protein
LLSAIQSVLLTVLLLLPQMAFAVMPCCMLQHASRQGEHSSAEIKSAPAHGGDMAAMQHCHRHSAMNSEHPVEAAAKLDAAQACATSLCALQSTPPAAEDSAASAVQLLPDGLPTAWTVLTIPVAADLAMMTPLPQRQVTCSGRAATPLRI